MKKTSRLAQRPTEEVAAARAFYADIGQDVRYFSALWHTFSVGHMLTNDLDRICWQFGLSNADFYLMGALRIDRPQPLRATDLAVTLQVSNGALTARVVKLGDKGLLTKSPVPGDARAFTLQLSSEGAASSGNLTYSAGDVTVRSNLTVHSAGTNVTDDPRRTYIVIVNPADACWNGGPADAFQTDGLTLHKELDDERFPVIG